MMTKASWLLLCVSALFGVARAEQADSCAGLEGSALNQCRIDQQNQLDQQQREIQQQLESMRLQNESLRKQLEREPAIPAARPVAADYSRSAEVARSADLKSWKAANPWFGSDYDRTQFAVRYMKQLQQERPELAGRELLDALSAKVNETFGAKH
jgi:hypothetical protein